MRPLHRFFIICSVSLLLTPFAAAQNMSGPEIYQRCHLRLVRALPAAADPLLESVRSGKKSATDACADLLKEARFSSAGVLQKRDDVRAKAILKTLHDFHRTYFQSRRNETAIGASYLVRDMEEAPLYLTRALFQPGEKFSSIVTLDSGLQGIRDREFTLGSLSEFTSQLVARYSSTHPRFGDRDLHIAYFRTDTSSGSLGTRIEAASLVPNIVDSGKLVGVAGASSLKLPGYVALTTAGPIRAAMIEQAPNFEANAHFGGGLVGSQAFIMNNANLTINQVARDYELINRRLTSRIYEDLLCHQMPSLTAEDVEAEVIPDSPHPFQTGSSCMQCHSSIDPLAYTYRNVFIFRSIGNDMTQGLPMTGLTQFPSSPTATVFAMQPPKGRLMYRQLLDGPVKRRNVNSIREIGHSLSQERDLYLCAAKKYYRFITGIDVNLIRRSDTAIDRVHQELVEQLGANLYKHQSLETMLKEIFASKPFQTRNMMTTEAQ